MRKYLLVLVIIVFGCLNVFATGGGLRKNSIKTCPNGVTYGMHGDGNGATHWHVAVTNGHGYYASGNAIYSDPCPSSNTNQGTAGSTSGNSSSSSHSSSSSNYGGYSNNSSNNNSYSGSNNNGSSANSHVTTNTTPKAPVVVKSSDNTLSSLYIDDENVEVEDKMEYTTTEKNVVIKAEAKDDKAKVSIDGEYTNLKLGNNKINIIVTAENGSKKEYLLNIEKRVGQSFVTVEKFSINNEIATIENNKIDLSVLYGTDKLDYEVELSDSTATFKIYQNNIEVSKGDEIKIGDNEYKLIITDSNGDEETYDLVIKRNSKTFSAMVYLLAGIIIFGAVIVVPIFLICLVIKSIKK